MPKALQAVDGIYGGYILLTPTSSASASIAALDQARKKSGRVFAATVASSAPVPLSVPYQGSTKDYSTLGQEKSLILFVPAMPELDPTSSEALSLKPPLFLCDAEGTGKCGYNPKTLKASTSVYIKGYRFASTLLRPVADVKVQVGSLHCWLECMFHKCVLACNESESLKCTDSGAAIRKQSEGRGAETD